MEVLVNNGPIGVAIDATPWADYGGGIMDACSELYDTNININHAVTIIGYGEEDG